MNVTHTVFQVFFVNVRVDFGNGKFTIITLPGPQVKIKIVLNDWIPVLNNLSLCFAAPKNGNVLFQ